MRNIYEQISANKNRSNLIIAVFIGFIFAASYLITKSFNLDPSFIFFGFLFSLISTGVSYYYGDKIALNLNGAKPANRSDYFDFYTVTENLSLANETPMPQIYVIDSPAPNAFATGRDPNHASICATTGLLSKLNRTQLEGVIAHELSHVKNYDTRLMTLVSVLIGSLSILIDTAYRASFFSHRSSDEDNKGGGVIAILGLALIIFAPIIAQLIQLAISRRREYLADAMSVKLTRQPQGLIEALKIISSDTSRFTQASTATASLYIDNPFKQNKIASLFSTHPPVAKRIQALEQML